MRTVATLGILFVTSIFALGQSIEDLAAPITSGGEWFRLLVTFASVAMAAYLAWKMRVDKGLQRTIDVQRQELMVLDQSNKRMKETEIERDKTLALRDSEVAALKLECQHLRDKTNLEKVTEMLTEASVLGSERYKEAMETVGKMLNNLENQARINTEHSEKNYKILGDVLNLINERWKVENGKRQDAGSSSRASGENKKHS